MPDGRGKPAHRHRPPATNQGGPPLKPLLHPRLVNPPTGDPGLLVEFLFERRALLLDLGDNAALVPRTLLRVSHAFVSHAHMDHFAGFDRLLRLCLGRPKALHLVGHAGFADRVAGKLAGYTWNLAPGYANDFTITATEVHGDGRAVRAAFRTRTGFAREDAGEHPVADGVVLAEEGLRVRAAVLDHGTPCLAFAVEEPAHVNVWKAGLEAMGLTTGPWLRDLKRRVLRGDPDDTPVVAARSGAPGGAVTVPLGALRQRALAVVAGQRIAYVVDCGFTPGNARRVVDLARGADVLFIETPFLDADAGLAAGRNHLTAAQAGRLAAAAGVRRLVPFHFSPRYAGREALLAAEAEAAFRAGPAGALGLADC